MAPVPSGRGFSMPRRVTPSVRRRQRAARPCGDLPKDDIRAGVAPAPAWESPAGSIALARTAHGPLQRIVRHHLVYLDARMSYLHSVVTVVPRVVLSQRTSG